MKKMSALFLVICISVMILQIFTVFAEAPDKTALEALYNINKDRTNTGYTTASFLVLTNALANSAAVIADVSATEETVEAQLEALKSAVNGLYEGDPSLTAEVTATKDAYVQRGNGNTTYNTGDLVAKYPASESGQNLARRSFIGFNISSLSADSTQVILKLYVTLLSTTASYKDTINVHSTGDSWAENTITWNNMPTSYSASPIASYGPEYIGDSTPELQGYIDFDVTEYVVAEKAKGSVNISFAIAATDSGSSYVIMHSKENTYAPKLVAGAASTKTVGELKEEDLDALNIEDYINDTSTGKITADLNTLPTIGSLNSSNITWVSSNPEIMDTTGQIVARPAGNTEITLTAQITEWGVTHEKEFKLTIFMNTAGWTDLDYINYELNDLLFTDFCSQDINKIYDDITLPAISKFEFCTYTWSVSNPIAASIAGNTASFTIQNDVEALVALTVTAARGTATATKTYNLKLIRKFAENLLTNANITATTGKPRDALSVDFLRYWESTERDANPSITYKFAQKTKINAALFVERGDGISGFTISCSDDGETWKTIYTGTSLGDKNRNLIELPLTEAIYFKFSVTSKTTPIVSLYTTELYFGGLSDSLIVDMDILEVSIPRTTTVNITLPQATSRGTLITWQSSNPSVISNTGIVIRPSSAVSDIGLTATFKKGASEKSVSYPVSVPPYIATPGGGGGGGGGSSSGNGVSFVPQKTPDPLPVPEKSDMFSDVKKDNWAHDFIEKLGEDGIVDKSADNFRPFDSITREEFIKMLVLASGISMSGEDISYNDVDKNEWYYVYIKAAANAGITNGMGDGSFGVGSFITRQDMAVMTARILAKFGYVSPNDSVVYYQDEADISGYAREAVTELGRQKIMNGNDNKFLPKNNTNRAETSKIICLVMNILGGAVND